ncbi:tetratricopeptide repeat protein [Wolbachia pipientis]|nr:tetratricopeptide repeat protein [Wolbachia pipientis]
MLEQASVIQEKHYGPDHFEVARTLANLGIAYDALGNPQKAKKLLEWALPILEKYYGSDHLTVAIILENLGIVYGALGDCKKKRSCLNKL